MNTQLSSWPVFMAVLETAQDPMMGLLFEGTVGQACVLRCDPATGAVQSLGDLAELFARDVLNETPIVAAYRLTQELSRTVGSTHPGGLVFLRKEAPDLVRGRMVAGNGLPAQFDMLAQGSRDDPKAVRMNLSVGDPVGPEELPVLAEAAKMSPLRLDISPVTERETPIGEPAAWATAMALHGALFARMKRADAETLPVYKLHALRDGLAVEMPKVARLLQERPDMQVHLPGALRREIDAGSIQAAVLVTETRAAPDRALLLSASQNSARQSVLATTLFLPNALLSTVQAEDAVEPGKVQRVAENVPGGGRLSESFFPRARPKGAALH